MSFLIEGDKRCPKISADFANGLIEISGISLPENPYSYYLPIHDELDSYLNSPSDNTVLSFRLEYFNTGSALAIRNVIQKLNDKLPINSFSVKWFFEQDDIDMQDSGKEFDTLFSNTTFEIIEVEEF